MNDTEDHQHDEERVPVPVENPHASTRRKLSPTKGFAARIVVPLCSSQYRTNMTEHCLLRCLTQHDSLKELYDPSEETPLLDDTAKVSHLWRAPKLKTSFSAKEFWSLYHAHFKLAAPLLFHHLRETLFHLPADTYNPLFTQRLKPISNLGFSGSTFFLTQPPKLLIKSVGRRFEYTFLYTQLIEAYHKYLRGNHSQHSETFLCQITDVVYSFTFRLGEALGISPGHYLVMRNILERPGYEKWDLKPSGFFEPTRDLVPDDMKSGQAKSGLADELPDDVRITLATEERETVMERLRKDTNWLCEMATIDYSLLLGRWKTEEYGDEEEGQEGVWRSPDGKWVYRMALVDYLWNVDQLRPKIMQTAGMLLPEQTVTTEPERYRNEFMKMMEEYVKVWEEEDAE